jgi:hypothetical protein
LVHKMNTNKSFDPHEMQEGANAFRAYENRDAIYKVSTFLADHFWGDHP